MTEIPLVRKHRSKHRSLSSWHESTEKRKYSACSSLKDRKLTINRDEELGAANIIIRAEMKGLLWIEIAWSPFHHRRDMGGVFLL